MILFQRHSVYIYIYIYTSCICYLHKKKKVNKPLGSTVSNSSSTRRVHCLRRKRSVSSHMSSSTATLHMAGTWEPPLVLWSRWQYIRTMVYPGTVSTLESMCRAHESTWQTIDDCIMHLKEYTPHVHDATRSERQVFQEMLQEEMQNTAQPHDVQKHVNDRLRLQYVQRENDRISVQSERTQSLAAVHSESRARVAKLQSKKQALEQVTQTITATYPILPTRTKLLNIIKTDMSTVKAEIQSARSAEEHHRQRLTDSRRVRKMPINLVVERLETCLRTLQEAVGTVSSSDPSAHFWFVELLLRLGRCVYLSYSAWNWQKQTNRAVLDSMRNWETFNNTLWQQLQECRNCLDPTSVYPPAQCAACWQRVQQLYTNVGMPDKVHTTTKCKIDRAGTSRMGTSRRRNSLDPSTPSSPKCTKKKRHER